MVTISNLPADRQRNVDQRAQPTDQTLATLPIRFAALLVDSLLYGSFLLLTVLGGTFAALAFPGYKDQIVLTAQALQPVVLVGYFSFFESSRAQATVGKRLFGIVVGATGDRVQQSKVTLPPP